MLFIGLIKIGFIISSFPKTLPYKTPKIIDEIPPAESMDPYTFCFLSRRIIPD